MFEAVNITGYGGVRESTGTEEAEAVAVGSGLAATIAAAGFEPG